MLALIELVATLITHVGSSAPSASVKTPEESLVGLHITAEEPLCRANLRLPRGSQSL